MDQELLSAVLDSNKMDTERLHGFRQGSHEWRIDRSAWPGQFNSDLVLNSIDSHVIHPAFEHWPSILEMLDRARFSRPVLLAMCSYNHLFKKALEESHKSGG